MAISRANFKSRPWSAFAADAAHLINRCGRARWWNEMRRGGQINSCVGFIMKLSYAASIVACARNAVSHAPNE
jgi:hypothetical protein